MISYLIISLTFDAWLLVLCRTFALMITDSQKCVWKKKNENKRNEEKRKRTDISILNHYILMTCKTFIIWS